MIETILVLALAVWRLSTMLIQEDGPMAVFEKLREWVFSDVADGEMAPRGSLAWLFTCVPCMSMILSIPVWGFWVYAPDLTLVLVGAFALSALVVAFERIMNMVKEPERDEPESIFWRRDA